MRQFNTVVLERMIHVDKDFATEPYECGWASEAIFFIRLYSLEGQNTSLQAQVEISADGIHWVAEGTELPIMKSANDFFCKVHNFGGWLRLNCRVAGESPDIKTTIYLVLKE